MCAPSNLPPTSSMSDVTLGFHGRKNREVNGRRRAETVVLFPSGGVLANSAAQNHRVQHKSGAAALLSRQLRRRESFQFSTARRSRIHFDSRPNPLRNAAPPGCTQASASPASHHVCGRSAGQANQHGKVVPACEKTNKVQPKPQRPDPCFPTRNNSPPTRSIRPSFAKVGGRLSTLSIPMDATTQRLKSPTWGYTGSAVG